MIKKRTQAIFSDDDGEAYGGGMMKKLSASHGKKWLQKFVFANMKTDTWQDRRGLSNQGKRRKVVQIQSDGNKRGVIAAQISSRQ